MTSQDTTAGTVSAMATVDDDELYARLSDALLWTAIQENALRRAPSGFRFLEAGGGTGRWSKRVLDAYPDCSGVLYDPSADVVADAERALVTDVAAGRLRTTVADLADASSVEGTEVFDVILCLHHVIGMVSDPLTVVVELARTLAPGGRLVVFAPNKYHVAYFNLARGEVEMAGEALTARGRLTADTPEMTLFTPAILADLCVIAGLELEVATGFPVLLYPGEERCRAAVSFDEIYQLERIAMEEPEVGARGNNLYLVAVRRW
jgi:SAM-dependent methyltransferase